MARGTHTLFVPHEHILLEMAQIYSSQYGILNSNIKGRSRTERPPYEIMLKYIKKLE